MPRCRATSTCHAIHALRAVLLASSGSGKWNGTTTRTLWRCAWQSSAQLSSGRLQKDQTATVVRVLQSHCRHSLSEPL